MRDIFLHKLAKLATDFEEDNDNTLTVGLYVTIDGESREKIPANSHKFEYDGEKMVPAVFNVWNSLREPDVAPNRKMWRTLVRVVEVNNKRGCFYVVVPGWDIRDIIRLDLDSVPDELRMRIKPDKRLYAWVNTGAENAEDLSFERWEDA